MSISVNVDETARVRSALSVIPADDYNTWVDMAFALKQGFGEAGFDIWDEWSRTAGNYNERSARTTWRSAREAGGKTLASLFWLARQHGFDLKRTHYPDRMATALAPRSGRPRTQGARRSPATGPARSGGPGGTGNLAVGATRRSGTPVSRSQASRADAVHCANWKRSNYMYVLGYVPTSEEQPLMGRVLLVPCWIGEAISTLELIDEHGRKSSLAGGVKRGGYWIAGPTLADGELNSPILIGEGMATVLSAHRATEELGGARSTVEWNLASGRWNCA